MIGKRPLCLWAVVCLATVCPADDSASITGKWKIRIDGGGEIYSAVLAVESNGEDGSLAGTYETDGRRAKLEKISYSNGTLIAVVNTQRFSNPVVATFTADVDGDQMSGEVDFDSGPRSRSYDFVANLISRSEGRSGVPQQPEPTQRKPTERPLSVGKNAAVSSVSFRNGDSGYNKALDVEIWAIAPSKSLLRQGTMTTDGNNGGGESQVLLRFNEIIGTAKGQIPAGARIKSARLTVVAFDPGTTCYLHRLLIPWTDAVTWDRVANGITVDNIEASTVRDGFTFAEINMDKQLVHFDVTPTVQLWADGVENFGWVFVNTGGNGWDFYSSDWGEKEFRPMLEVTYTLNRTQTITAKVKP